jgi:hypothetical protein
VSHLPIIKELKEKGKVTFKDKDNRAMIWILPSFWKAEEDGNDGVFLLYDTFQIRSVGEPFSEVALDIVEYSNKPVIFHTPVSRVLKQGPINDNLVKFFLIKNEEWKKLLFGIGQPVIMNLVNSSPELMFPFPMPIFSVNVKEMYLGSEGEVKILKA